MGKKKSNKVSEKGASAYTHDKEAAQRADVGVQPEFDARKEPQDYRYDSSVAPELSWDESSERAMAEWLLNLVGKAAEKGDENVTLAASGS
jgi:adenine-specific DNA-methyltransferase